MTKSSAPELEGRSIVDELYNWLNQEYVNIPTNQKGGAGAKNRGIRIGLLMARNQINILEKIDEVRKREE